MSHSQVTIQDKPERIEVMAVPCDQESLQKVIDRLSAIKVLLPEKPKDMNEAAN